MCYNNDAPHQPPWERFCLYTKNLILLLPNYNNKTPSILYVPNLPPKAWLVSLMLQTSLCPSIQWLYSVRENRVNCMGWACWWHPKSGHVTRKTLWIGMPYGRTFLWWVTICQLCVVTE